VDGECSRWFDSKVGVRQGCVLSLILFSIFIEGLAAFIKSKGIGVNVGPEKLSLLLFADGHVMFSERE
jgi:hypothetical protein